MDKKRRKKKTSENANYKKKWLAAMTLTSTYVVCGITYKKFEFLDNYGQGNFEYYSFDGLYLGITDVQLIRDFKLTDSNHNRSLELSFLIEGEQIINVEGIPKDIIYESQESYLVNVSELQTCITYHKNKRLKEVRIRISPDFIKRHHIDDSYNILESYSISKIQGHYLKPLCVKTQEILSEILGDTRTGLLKRLFLESKTLELIALQLDSKSSTKSTNLTQTDNLVKKIYKVQHIIASDLSVQYSIQELAREVGLNDFMLKKEYKRVFNQTVFEYASSKRMEKAKQLLQHTTKPIYEISELVGYKNATHFSAAFKKLEKMTPKKYRESLLSKI